VPPEREDGTIRRGPKLRGDLPRKRFNVSLNPAIVDQAKELAESKGETLSGMIERLLCGEIEKEN
jgi:hypothetical protein